MIINLMGKEGQEAESGTGGSKDIVAEDSRLRAPTVGRTQW